MRLPVAFLVALVSSAAYGQGDEPKLEPSQESTLHRLHSHVVVQGARLPRMQGVPIGELRLYGWTTDGLKAIPYQIDERTPEEAYAYASGRNRLSDTDQRRLDTNDELVFMARDVGDRVPVAGIHLGQDSVDELRVFDPLTREHGWVYLLRFTKAPPPAAAERYLTIDWKNAEFAGWSSHVVKVATVAESANFLDLRLLRFADANGEFGPDVLDRTKLSFEGAYLFLRLRRRIDETRAKIVSYLDGPIRMVASVLFEVYLTWDHWVRSTRGRLKLYANRLELELDLAVPVTFEKTPRSRVRFSLDFSPAAGKVRLRTDTNHRRITLDGTRDEDLRKVDRSLPRWIHASTSTGTVLTRLHLQDSLRRPGHALFIADGPEPDGPEEFEGSHGNAGYELDLTGLEKGNYGLKLIIQFGPSGARPEELLRIDDVPLKCEATR